MIKVKKMNAIAQEGLELFDDKYTIVENDDNDINGILVRSASLHDYEFNNDLIAIARAGAGVNNIPIEKCAEKGIVVFNTPGANANGVKELVIAGLLLASRDLPGALDWIQTIKDKGSEIPKIVEKNKSNFAGPEIFGKKLGVIGLGAIGSLVANAADALGMDVLGHDPFISVESAWGLSRNVKKASSIEEIFESCDYITLHVPLIDSTRGMINKDTIGKMKEGIRILNFSRGELVNDDDIAVALETGKVSKYVTDFPNDKTLTMKNAVCLPHLGASTPESEINCAKMAVYQMRQYIEHGNIINSVNYPECNIGVCNSAGRVVVNHKNIPNMVSQISSVFSKKNINISNMINKSKGNFAYTVLDVEDKITDDFVKMIEDIDGIIKVRVIK